MQCKTLFVMMPEVERFAARDVPKKKQAVAIQLALRLVRLRAAWEAVNKVRTKLLEDYDRDEEGNLKPADATEFGIAWDESLEQDYDISVTPVNDLLSLAPDASASEIAALVAIGLYEPAAGEESDEGDEAE
jgi:hypothetical protein